MDLKNLRLEDNSILNQSLQPKFSNYSSAFPVLSQLKQTDSDFANKTEPEKQTVSKEDTLTAIEQGNKLMELFNRDLRFEIHEETGIVQISIIDRNEGNVVKQIPPDAVLNMIANIRDILDSLEAPGNLDVKA